MVPGGGGCVPRHAIHRGRRPRASSREAAAAGRPRRGHRVGLRHPQRSGVHPLASAADRSSRHQAGQRQTDTDRRRRLLDFGLAKGRLDEDGQRPPGPTASTASRCNMRRRAIRRARHRHAQRSVCAGRRRSIASQPGATNERLAPVAGRKERHAGTARSGRSRSIRLLAGCSAPR